MGRKGKNKGAKQSAILHKETFQRMNYLYQAALAALSATPSQPQVSRFYIRTMKTIGTRMVLRMDPSIKRTLCKSCDTVLVPGVTCTQRMRSRREKHVVLRCLTCGSVKRFLTHSNYQLWSAKPENMASASYQGQAKLEDVESAGSQGQTVPDNTAPARSQRSPTKAGQ